MSENMGVKCDVTECVYHCEGSKCRLGTINVTHSCQGTDCASTPHFCSSYEKR